MKNRKVYSRIFVFLKKYRGYIFISFLLSIITVAAQLTVPILSGMAIDHMIEEKKVDFNGIISIIIIMLAAILIAALAQLQMNRINNRITYDVIKDIRNQAFNKLSHLSLKYIDKHEYGDIVSRVVADVDQFSDGLLMGFTQLFTGVITILGTFIFMLYVNVWITIGVVLLTPISLFVASFVAKKTFHLFTEQSQDRGELTGLVNEMIGSEKVVQAFGYEKRAQERFEKINESLAKNTLSATFFSALTNPSTRLINNIVYASVGVAGAFMCIGGVMTVGGLQAFLQYATQYAKPINEISGVATELQNAVACAGRVFELIDEPAEEDAGSFELKNAEGHVELKNVEFSYLPERPLITNLNLSVKPGMRVAIVGPTGCGKSTIINLLMRFYDVKNGSICVDENDIRRVSKGSLRKSYGMVLQETWLKQGTVFENIAFGSPDATMEDVKNAAKKTEADSFIRRLSNGYDTVISEDGGELSEGQKQLLCITRVMLHLPPMLILDEATSSIDTMTERRVQEAFNVMMKGRTSFIVAHRLSTIQNADLILVMNEGHIVEKGSHEELIKKHGFYEKLYNSQFDPT